VSVHYRYRVQVGDEYTYRDSSYRLDKLVWELLNGYEDIETTLAKLQGKKTKAKKRPPAPVPFKDIQITVVPAPPTKEPQEEKWHKGKETSPTTRLGRGKKAK